MRTNIESDFKLFGHRLAGVEARVGNLERDAEVTGTHNVANLEKQLDDAKKAGWDRLKLVVYCVAALLGGSGIGAAVTHAIH